jgi:SNF2 family DNA or RNA helicase
MEYYFRTTPFSHQRLWWEKTRDREAFAVLWEQGTGKTKLTVDTAAWLFQNGKIDTLFVLAPNGVHRNWIVNEVPTHLPESILWRGLLWHSSKANTAGARKEAADALQTRHGLLVVAMSYDALMTKAGDDFAQKLLTGRKVLMVLDESARIKNPKAKRTIRVLARGRRAAYRRILTGTPVANSPFDVFTQFGFLSPTIWADIGCSSFSAFKTYFGIWIERLDPRSGRTFRELLRYKNLEQLAAITERISTRVTKAAVLDLPEKLYVKRYFDLGPEQARTYALMKEGFHLQLEAGEVNAMLAITQLLRFQQIASGWITNDEKTLTVDLENPRLDTLMEILEDLQGKAIVWAKFTREIDTIMVSLKKAGIEAVRYDGQSSQQDRADAITSFQDGSARVFVANPAAAGEGLTLHAATTVIYYSNSFKLTDRLQSEDRAHRIGQRHPVTYYDLIATDTVDEKIVDALRAKLDIASTITGDAVKKWI